MYLGKYFFFKIYACIFENAPEWAITILINNPLKDTHYTELY